MDNLKNYTVMSLGFNCTMKRYTKEFIDQPTYLFDWIGSPMWGINKFINNNFDLFNTDDYGPVKIYNNKSDIIYCNKKYYFKFIHDLQPNTEVNRLIAIKDKYGSTMKINYFNNFKEKYQRRINKFIELLNSGNSVVFLRLEENMIDKVMYDEYNKSYSKPEIEHIYEFMNIMKKKYSTLKYKIIYFTKLLDTEIKDNLLIIKDTINIIEGDSIKNVGILLDNNKDVINKFLIL